MLGDFSLSQPITNQDFSEALAKLRTLMEKEQSAQLVYGAIMYAKGGVEVMIGGKKSVVKDQELFSWLKTYQRENDLKIGAVSLSGKTGLHKIASRLWLELDIVPILDVNEGDQLAEKVAATISKFDNNGIAHLEIDDQNEVNPSFLVTLEDYEQTAAPELWQELLSLSKKFKNRRLLFISATPRGGGVALMRHAIIRLYRLLGVEAHWHILTEDNDIFNITKSKFHNVLQGMSDPSIRLTEDDKHLFEAWSQTNARILEPAILAADVIVIDDPQPSALIPKIKQLNPKVKLLYRSHIQIKSKLVDVVGSPQHETWQYIWHFAKQADIFISHPVEEFIPSTVPREKVVKMPPTTDPLDGLNKSLDTEQTEYYLKILNHILLQENQPPLDLERPYIIQIARFDPSKGIPDVVESYRLLRQKLKAARVPAGDVPQLVIVGHGSIDDPDGRPLLAFTREMLFLPLYQELAQDVKVARLPHIDQLLNALLRRAQIVLQLSHSEGYEIKVSEALLKGKPVISYRAGGIPLQIVENENGFVIDPIGDTEAVSEKLFQLITDRQLYARMSRAAIEKASQDVLTIPNAMRWLRLSL